MKWGAAAGPSELAGLKDCQKALGKAWRIGVLLYSGERTLALDPKTIAVPFSVFLGRDAGG